MRFAVTFLFAASALTAALTQPVPTESGMLKGAPGTDKSITVFKGVPFAAPPVGDKRWRAPEPPVKWEGVRAADAFGANCVQTITREKKPWTYEFMAHGDVSEDCLFLNIWTAAARAGEKRPVFVYLHGGANTEGSGSIDSYNGEGLARKGVLMITVNYRLGVFGFFTHPELTKESDGRGAGNFALMDQMAALRWVKRNIAAFGGDPDRVTVAGQSAGASDIALLLRSPLAKGLFQRAIMESGGAPGNGGARPLAASEADGVKFAAAKGAATLAQLRALSSQEIFAPVTGVRFGPVTDGYVVPSEPYINDVPTLTGSNADENGATHQPHVTAAQFEAQAKQRYGEAAAELLKLYPVSGDDAGAQSNEAARDRQRVALSEWAAARSQSAKSPAYLYFYNHVLPGPDSAQYGAFHTSEVPYVLNSLAFCDRPFAAEDRKIADTLSQYWANFAANGDPNGKGLPHWPSTSEKPGVLMELGDENKAIPAAGSDAKFTFLRSSLQLGK
jgi:para-nitrobenzyl esterase